MGATPKHSCLLTVATVALAWGLTACGGGGGSQSAADAGVSVDAGSTGSMPAAEARLTAFTFPFWTTFPITVSKDNDGQEVLRVVKEKPEVYRARKKVRSEFSNVDV